MKKSFVGLGILSIFIATLVIGMVVFDRNSVVDPDVNQITYVVEESDDVPVPGVEPYFETLVHHHTPIEGGLSPYLNYLRLNQKDLCEFEDVLSSLQVLLENYGMSQPLREPGMYSIFDVGEKSRYQLVTQRNATNTDAAVVLVDLKGASPYTSKLVYRGDISHIELDRVSQTLTIVLRDSSIKNISWGELGVD